MKLCNLESLPGQQIIRELGVVSGSTVRSKHVGKDLFAGFKNLVGGELTAYTELLQESREQAVSRMVDEAEKLGATAVLGVRFSTSNIAQGAAELFVYGTAVVTEPLGSSAPRSAESAQAPQNISTTRLPNPFD
jgi:uncharacterized protein YbjQ (UPF0145 family)